MGFYRFAGYTIELKNRYPFTERLCVAYRTDATEADFSVEATEEQIRAERQEACHTDSAGYCESICLYRNLCSLLPQHDAFLLHAAVVRVGSDGYAFLGHSGAGKSTHMLLWQKTFPNDVHIVNGDKPILRRRTEDGIPRFYAFGTPWAGKEGLQSNTCAPLKGLCFIVQGKENSIRRLSPSDTAQRIFHQFLIPKDAAGVMKLMQLADELVRFVPAYELTCDVSEAAAILSFTTMTGRTIE